ncbi:MAG: hypothetical protein V4547_13370 [Bacteroidota bacterium]
MSKKIAVVLGLLFSVIGNQVCAATLLDARPLEKTGGYKCYIRYNNGVKKWTYYIKPYIMGRATAFHNCDNEIWMLSAMGQ